jgi:hypothetical protein
MRYDLELANVVCSEQGFPTVRTDDRLEATLGKGTVLCVQNDERDEDCLIGFKDTPWHTHNGFMFSDARGYYVELGYLEVLTGLGDGSILVCELMDQGTIKDRWLIHRDYNNEYTHMQLGDQVIVSRAAKSGA